MGTSARITQKLTSDESEKTSDYLTMEVSNQKLKRELKITTDKKGNVYAHIKLQLKIIALEAPRDNLYKMGEREKLNRELSKQLTKEAKQITKKLQKQIVMLSVSEDTLSLIILIYGRKKIGIKIMQK